MKINNFQISIRKTKIVDIDKDAHSLPPDHGPFPEYKVADYNCPEEWSRDGFFIPVKEGDPLWIDFRGNNECACILSVQRLNPITGKPANLKEGLQKDPEQNYMVLPKQIWIDGYVNEGKVYQFIITKAGEGLAVNEYLLPEEMQDSHAIGLAFFGLRNPKSKEVVRYHYPYNIPPLDLGPIPWYDPSWWLTWSDTVDYNDVRTVFRDTTATIMNCKRALQCSGGNVDTAKCILQGEVKGESFSKGLSAYSSPSNTSECYIQASGAAASDADCVDIFNVDIIDGRRDRTSYASSPDTDDILDTPENIDKASMGAGGRIDQEVLTDANTVEYYTKEPLATIPIYLALPEQFKTIMRKGKRQDADKPDRYVHSGKIGGKEGTQVPLIRVNS